MESVCVPDVAGAGFARVRSDHLPDRPVLAVMLCVPALRADLERVHGEVRSSEVWYRWWHDEDAGAGRIAFEASFPCLPPARVQVAFPLGSPPHQQVLQAIARGAVMVLVPAPRLEDVSTMLAVVEEHGVWLYGVHKGLAEVLQGVGVE